MVTTNMLSHRFAGHSKTSIVVLSFNCTQTYWSPYSSNIITLPPIAVKSERNCLITFDSAEAISEKNYTKWNELTKRRNKLWNTAAKTAGKASRKAHNGVNSIEDIYDAISGGTLRDKTAGLYGHGSTYYRHDPGGEDAATETLANYCALALAYPELFELMAEEQPEIWEACGNIIKAMVGG